jgi:hypothetical protein
MTRTEFGQGRIDRLGHRRVICGVVKDQRNPRYPMIRGDQVSLKNRNLRRQVGESF